MNVRRRLRPLRRPAVIAALGLFLLGGNYCLLGMLAGDTRMACLTAPGDRDAPVPACHHSAPATDEGAGRPAHLPSCCPDPVVAPVAPVLEKIAAAASVIAAADLADTHLFANRVAPPTWHGHRPVPDAEPPPRLAHAPLPARAPPLA